MHKDGPSKTWIHLAVLMKHCAAFMLCHWIPFRRHLLTRPSISESFKIMYKPVESIADPSMVITVFSPRWNLAGFCFSIRPSQSRFAAVHRQNLWPWHPLSDKWDWAVGSPVLPTESPMHKADAGVFMPDVDSKSQSDKYPVTWDTSFAAMRCTKRH